MVITEYLNIFYKLSQLGNSSIFKPEAKILSHDKFSFIFKKYYYFNNIV